MGTKGIIIIPDVHGRRFWLDALRKYSDDLASGDMHCVFLGDYLDPYPMEQESGIALSDDETVSNFRDIIVMKTAFCDSVTLILGNHDLHYVDGFQNEGEKCRYMYSHEPVIKKLFLDNWEKFSLGYETVLESGKRCLFSHAGVMKAWVDTRFDNMAESDITAAWLDSFLLDKEHLYILDDVGENRGGRGYGSPVWADADEFVYGFMNERHRDECPGLPQRVYTGIYQVFGHSLGHPYMVPDLFDMYDVNENFAMLDSRRAFIMDPFGTISEIS